MGPESPAKAATPGRARRIVHNAAALLGSESFSRVFAWLTILFMARHWADVSSYGQYALVLNWVTILSALSDLGSNSLTIREVAHDKTLSNLYLRNIAALRVLSAFAFIFLLAAIGFSLHYEPLVRWAMVVLGFRLLFEAFGNSYSVLFQAHEMMAKQGMVTLTAAFLRMAGIMAVVYLGGRLVDVCWVWVAVSFISFCIFRVMAGRQNWSMEWSRFRWNEAWSVLKKSLPFAAFGTFQMLYYRIDGVILKSFSGNEAVAFYDLAGRLLFTIFLAADLFSVSTLPAFSAVRDHRADFERLANRSLKVLTLFGMPIMVGGALLAGPLMVFLFGAKYAASGQAFAILSLSILPHFMIKPFVNVLAVKRPSRLSALFLSLFAVNIGLNFYFIPRWGLIGASMVSVISEGLALAACLWLTREFFKVDWRKLSRWFLLCVLASAALGLGVDSDPRLYWIEAGPCLYALGLWVFRVLEPEDWSSLRSVLKI